ncbi:MAG: ABC transporter permease, partial [Francisellaceae bacterium]|nr:ABC transporter permease [Francisellaceae bacterium]
MKIYFLWTDIFYMAYMLIAFIAMFYTIKHNKARWYKAFNTKTRMLAVSSILLYAVVGFIDSVHFQEKLSGDVDETPDYSQQITSGLDLLFKERSNTFEVTYSSPLATHSFVPEMENAKWVFPKLIKVDKDEIKFMDILEYIIKATLWLFPVLLLSWLYWRRKIKISVLFKSLSIPILVFITFGTLLLLSNDYHVLGTDKVGKDVFYMAIKSVRTGLLIGILTTSIIVPIAIVMGVMSGYFRGWIDDIIQYIYSTISSIPGVLLIAASVLSLQLWLEKHQNLFEGHANRIEMRLLLICIVLGVTGWTGLCRLLRAETLKLRELSYIDAAKILNVKPKTIIIRHILPNIMYLILISTVMDLSGLVLAESVLSYVGVGVDPSSYSWGNMINGARLELARSPIVWWSLFGAFSCMFIFVVSINIIAD